MIDRQTGRKKQAHTERNGERYIGTKRERKREMDRWMVTD